MSNLDSHELLQLYQNGDPLAATAIFDRYVGRLLSLARLRIGSKLRRRIDPEDVVQSAYRSFFVHAENEEFVLKRSGDLWRLLAAITLNKLRGQAERHTAARRSINREEIAESFANLATTGPEPTPVEVVAFIEQLHLVSERLASAERTVLVGRLQGRTIEQLAAAINKSPRTVRRLLAQARRQIEQQLAAAETLTSESNQTQFAHALDPRAPLLFADFMLERLMGAGGMGKVYRATQKSTGKQVAIKALLKSRQGNRRAVEKFLQEAQILARLSHPNIVGFHGLGRFPGGGYFIAMDYVKGTDLQSRIARGRLGIQDAARLVRDVAGAIAHAHEQGIVHGDLKPANVLLEPSGHVVVTDFGLAQFVVNQSNPNPPFWLFGGTEGYLAPEVRIYGIPPTPAADIYGLGALLWVLATGFVPNGPGSLSGNEVTPKAFSEICAKCLAVDPQDRFANTKELVNELSKLDKCQS